MLAETIVHTAGVNWSALTVQIGGITVAIFAAATYVTSRQARARDLIRQNITEQVTRVTSGFQENITALGMRLDRIDHHLSDQDRSIASQGERLARVEGRLGQGQHQKNYEDEA
jgi:hypothetical protein